MEEFKLDRIKIVTEVMCKNFNVGVGDLNNILKKKENKYLFFLLLRNYKCLDKEKLKELIEKVSDRSINYSLNKGEEKLLVNKQFRENYIKVEEIIDEII